MTQFILTPEGAVRCGALQVDWLKGQPVPHGTVFLTVWGYRE
jgi:hypothetical protein